MEHEASFASSRHRSWTIALGCAVALTACGGADEARAPSEPETSTPAAAAAADSAQAAAPVRRWLPDDMRRSTRAERFPHEAHVSVSCRVCHQAPRGHTVHTDLTCSQCHRASALATRQSLTPADCQACHHDPARNLTCDHCHGGAPAPKTTQQRFRLSVWADARTRELPFDHALHQSQTCPTCHQDRPSMAFTRTCGSCHANHHRADARCSTCHPQPPPTAHGLQAHTTCQGSGCHDAPDLDAINDRRPVCLVCHRDRENHGEGRQCVTCHQMRMGSPAAPESLVRAPDAQRKEVGW